MRNYSKNSRQPRSNITNLPTFSAIITETEGNEDGEPIYQYQILKYYTQEKMCMKNHGAELNLYCPITLKDPVMFIQKEMARESLVMVITFCSMFSMF